MGGARKYYVYSSGEIVAGFATQEVINAFAALFKISPEEATEYVKAKKLIGNALSSSEVTDYTNQIKAVGLVTVVVGEDAVNDPLTPASEVRAESIPVNEDTTPVDSAQKKPEPIEPQAICPKCGTMQPRADACKKCHLIFCKYSDPNYHTRDKSEPGDVVNANDAGRGIKLSVGKYKNAIAFMLGVALVVGVFNAMKPAANSTAVSGASFVQKSQAGPKVNQLMQTAGLNTIFIGFGKELEQLFREKLPQGVKERGGTPENAAYAISMVPNAFNEEGATVALANWLQMTLKENEIDTLIETYSLPKVGNAIEAAASAQNGTALHDSFLASYENKPPGPRRRSALLKLVEILSLDELGVMIFTQGQKSVIEVAASTVVDFKSDGGQQLTRRNTDDMRDMLPHVKPHIKEEMIKGLAWQFADYTLFELQDLAIDLNTPEVRRLHQQVGRGIENYMFDATSWLVTISAQNAGTL